MPLNKETKPNFHSYELFKNNAINKKFKNFYSMLYKRVTLVVLKGA